jgi:tetratricopeptide (TPR) repeat protein
VAGTLSKDAVYGLGGGFALAAIPARYALERRAWDDAAKLEPRQGPLGFTEAMTRFARALGAARGGHPEAARAEVVRLAALRDELASRDAYWSEQVEIQRKAAEAWASFAEGRKGEALALLREAADQEDKTEKSAVSPGPLAPARELLGEMLLEAGQPKEALVEFLASTKKEPNRFRGVAGAARAAELAGDKAQARQHYRQLLAIGERADSQRPELLAARKFLGRPAPKG